MNRLEIYDTIVVILKTFRLLPRFLRGELWREYGGDFEPHGIKGTYYDIKLAWDLSYHCASFDPIKSLRRLLEIGRYIADKERTDNQ